MKFFIDNGVDVIVVDNIRMDGISLFYMVIEGGYLLIVNYLFFLRVFDVNCRNICREIFLMIVVLSSDRYVFLEEFFFYGVDFNFRDVVGCIVFYIVVGCNCVKIVEILI